RQPCRGVGAPRRRAGQSPLGPAAACGQRQEPHGAAGRALRRHLHFARVEPSFLHSLRLSAPAGWVDAARSPRHADVNRLAAADSCAHLVRRTPTRTWPRSLRHPSTPGSSSYVRRSRTARIIRESHAVHEVASSQLRSRFRLEAELARGGMGTVFSALDTATGQRVALKRLSPGAPAEARALFEREYCVLSSLRHPRIIEVYEYALDAEGPFYTMELLEGSDLRELAPLPPLAACGYL